MTDERYVHIQKESFPSKENDDLRYNEEGEIVPPVRGECVVFEKKTGFGVQYAVEQLWLSSRGGGGSGVEKGSGMELNIAKLLADSMNQKNKIDPWPGSKIGEMRAYQKQMVDDRLAEIERHKKAMGQIEDRLNRVTELVDNLDGEFIHPDVAYEQYRKVAFPPRKGFNSITALL